MVHFWLDLYLLSHSTCPRRALITVRAARKRTTKAFHFVAVPLLRMSVSVTNSLCSLSFLICLHLAPTGEGQSIDLLSPLPASAVKSAPAQPPPPTSLSSGLALMLSWLLSFKDRLGKGPTRASQGPHKIKKPRLYGGLRDSPPRHNLALSEYQTAWDSSHRGCVCIC